MVRFRAVAAGILAMLVAACPAWAGYELVTLAGDTFVVQAVRWSAGYCLATTVAGEEIPLPGVNIDYEATFRRNLESDSDGFVFFRNGSLLKYEGAAPGEGLIEFDLGGKSSVKIPEGLIDFRLSVRETAAGREPEVRGGHDIIARPRSGGSEGSGGSPRGPKRIAAAAGSSKARTEAARRESLRQMLDERRARESDGRSSDDDASGGGGPRRYSKRPPSSSSSPSSPSLNSSLSPAGTQTTPGRRGRQEPGTQLAQGGFDPDLPTGEMTVVVRTSFGGPVGGVQLSIAHPLNTQMRNVQPLGAFAVGGMPVINPACNVPGAGRPVVCWVLLMSLDQPARGPGDVAQFDFTWSGQPPSMGEFELVQVIASSPESQPLQSFQANMVLR